MRSPDDGLPGTIRPCADAQCPFQVQITDGGWFHVDTHGARTGHDAAPAVIECSKRCGHRATRIDSYGDRRPICAHCFDRIDAERWAAGHGMPVPGPDSDLPPCVPVSAVEGGRG